MDLRIELDRRYRPVHQSVVGGTFISKAEYEGKLPVGRGTSFLRLRNKLSQEKDEGEPSKELYPHLFGQEL